jgi:site-specific recombinase
MLNCRDVGSNATEFLSGALPLKTNLLVIWHVLRCGNCRLAIIQIITLLMALRKRKAKSVSDEQVYAWLKALEEHKHSHPHQ